MSNGVRCDNERPDPDCFERPDPDCFVTLIVLTLIVLTLIVLTLIVSDWTEFDIERPDSSVSA